MVKIENNQKSARRSREGLRSAENDNNVTLTFNFPRENTGAEK